MSLSKFDLSLFDKLKDGVNSLKDSLNENVFSNVKNLVSNFSKSSETVQPLFTLARNDLTDTSMNFKLSNPFIEKTSIVPKSFFTEHRTQILSILSRLLGLTISGTVTYFLFKWLMKTMDPTNADKLAAKSRADKILKEIGLTNVELNEYELFIATNIVMPQNIDCSWNDIGGLDHIVTDLKETVVYPLKNFTSNSTPAGSPTNSAAKKRSRLIQPPKGVLLFGPPGNAKTMIAKALAKESGARFINLQVSTLFDKWFGESQKRTEAVFTLAAKVQPVIIFIDEIDSFLRSRRSDDHECTSTMKTQFMTLWDGLGTTKDSQNGILIIGATNRADDVDPAILRRMPQMFYIGLPNEAQRRKILQVILKDEPLDDDVDLDDIAKKTAEYSGSDLKELCRYAAMNSFLVSLKKSNEIEGATIEESTSEAHDRAIDDQKITKDDFDTALEKYSTKNQYLKKNRNTNFFPAGFS